MKIWLGSCVLLLAVALAMVGAVAWIAHRSECDRTSSRCDRPPDGVVQRSFAPASVGLLLGGALIVAGVRDRRRRLGR
jgi:hypothetical protein